MTYTVLELFAGCGGLAIGMEQAGLKTVRLIERDMKACMTLRRNRPDWWVTRADISSVDFAGIRADIVTGGIPCQPFSMAGQRTGFEHSSGTCFHDFVRAVKAVSPRLFVIENVIGLLSHDDGHTLAVMVKVLSALDYILVWKVLSAVDFGVAQTRRRLFLVGFRKDIRFMFPEPTTRKPLTIREVLKDVPPSSGIPLSPKWAIALAMLPPGRKVRDMPRETIMEMSKNMARVIYALPENGSNEVAVKVGWDEQCPTLLTTVRSAKRDILHPDNRYFTVRETARIQGFPDSWGFSGSKGAKYKQIGNAVPPPLGHAMGKAIMQALDGITPSFQSRISSF